MSDALQLTPTEIASFQARVLAWFDQHGRKDLPWQQDITPYRVWVSEIMLQQTQVATVIPYYDRFMATFPDIGTLAAAKEDRVLHLWTGLGYYARARNLHKTAKQIIAEYNGEFPDDQIALEGLPGIGRSTAGAILAIAHGQRAVILEANVKRVLARCFAIEGWPGTTATAKVLWSAAEQLTPDQRIGDYTQVMMDLGAILCVSREPKCSLCPLEDRCRAKQEQRISEFPGKKPKKAMPVRETCMVLVCNQEGEYLLTRRPTTGLWGGLWTFPEVEAELLADEIENRNWRQVSSSFAPFRNTFTHFHLDITPVQAECTVPSTTVASVDEEGTLQWVDPNDPPEIGLTKPTHHLLKLLAQCDEANFNQRSNLHGPDMTRTVHCSRYKKDLPGLDTPPMPGPRGEEIFKQVSAQAWEEWHKLQTMLINEKHLDMRDKDARRYLNAQRDLFLTGEPVDHAEGYIPPEE